MLGQRQAENGTAQAVELRRAAVVGLWVLLVLNIADVVLTRMMLDRGGIELNPVADRLLASNTTLAVKLAIIGALAYDTLRRRPRLAVVCFMWLVAGIYVLAVVLNGSQLVSTWD